jgi:hypothetical protein
LIEKEAANISNSKYSYSTIYDDHSLLDIDASALQDGEREKQMELMVR